MAQPTQPPELQNRAVSIVGSVGGPAGGYTVGVEHLFVRTPVLQLGARIGGAYADNVVWDGTSTTLTAGATYIHRIGHIGQQPVSLDTGLGVTRVHSEFDTGGIPSRRRSTSRTWRRRCALSRKAAGGRSGSAACSSGTKASRCSSRKSDWASGCKQSRAVPKPCRVPEPLR